MSISFSTQLITWQKQYGRHGLPWQNTKDPYRIWVSEIMLQQTQVMTVIPYYERFLERFSNIISLAIATEEEVLSYWSGLGYYSRGRNLHKAAQIIMQNYSGEFPRDFLAILSLPGIGRSTAAAISVFAFGEKKAILDGNVKRILTRYFGLFGPPHQIEKQLWEHAYALLPDQCIESYTQGLMDLGSRICTRKPQCSNCPLQKDCVAYQSEKTHLLPQPKVQKTRPKKQIRMLLIKAQEKILLQKRPPIGIWGSLWCFPEISLDEDIITYCSKQLLLEVSLEPSLPSFNHTFTHFHLEIHPQPLQLIQIMPGIADSQEKWVTKKEVLSSAIPAPIRKLIHTMS